MRGVAAIAVLIAHATAVISGSPLLEHKYMAVQFFFMLSGFVVMCAYEHRLKSSMKFREFALRRAIRLYPLMVVGALLGWCFLANFDEKFAGDPNGMLAVGAAALGLPYEGAQFGFGLFPVNPPVWSLFFELLAYCVFGLVIRWASTVLLCIAAAGGVFMYGFTAIHFEGYALPFWMEIFGGCASFTIGMLLWRAYLAGACRRFSLPFAALAALMVLICAAPKSAPIILNPLFVMLAFPAMIMLGANCRVGRAKEALGILGELSYPLYILHWPIILFSKHFLLSELGGVWTSVIASMLSVVISWVIYIVFDKPLRSYLSVKFYPAPNPVAHNA